MWRVSSSGRRSTSALPGQAAWAAPGFSFQGKGEKSAARSEEVALSLPQNASDNVTVQGCLPHAHHRPGAAQPGGGGPGRGAAGDPCHPAAPQAAILYHQPCSAECLTTVGQLPHRGFEKRGGGKKQSPTFFYITNAVGLKPGPNRGANEMHPLCVFCVKSA